MRKKLSILLAVIIVVSLFASIGCNSKTKKTDDEIVAGMVMASGGETFGLGDMGTYYLHGANVYHENLVCVDDKGEYTGLLAESWTTNDDASVWTFVIRDNVKWHDGVAFTADDVIFTIDYTLDKKPWSMNDAAFLNDLKTSTDPNYKAYYKGKNDKGKETVTIEMNGPYSNLLLNMRAGLSIFPKHIYEKVDDPMTYGNPSSELDAAIGTGPFVVKSLDTTSRTMTLERNDNYYLGNVKAKKLTVRYYSDANVMALALKNNDIDLCLAWGSGLSATAAESLKDASNVSLGKADSAAIYGIGFNCKKDPWTNPDLRVALSYAVDYEKLVELVLGGNGKTPGKSLIPQSMLYYKDNGKLSYDPEKAKSSLMALGYKDADNDGYLESPNGQKWQPVLGFNASNADRAEIIKTSFNKAGVDLQLEPVPTAWAAWKRQVDDNGIRLYDMVLTGCSHLGTYTYCNYGTTVISVNGGLKDCQIDTADFNKVLSNLKAAGNADKMKKAAADLQDCYAANMPLIPFYDQEIITAYGSDITGVYVDPQFAYTICHDTLMNVCFK
jgi:peptide/nickel transport system substrate-binding protein